MVSKDDTIPPPVIHNEPAFLFDWRNYQDFFEGSELSEAEQQEFIETLWSIIMHFVDLGIGLNPVEILCAQLDEKPSSDSDELLDSRNTHKPTPMTDSDDSSMLTAEEGVTHAR